MFRLIVIAGVVRRKNQREIAIGNQKECRWRNVIAILYVAVLKRFAHILTAVID